MIQCNRCNLQYIGETKRRLKDRFNDLFILRYHCYFSIIVIFLGGALRISFVA